MGAASSTTFRRVERLSSQAGWTEWSADMRSAIRCSNPDMSAILEWCERVPEYNPAGVEDRTKEKGLSAEGEDLYDMLVGLTTGARTVVRAIVPENGYTAWRRLYEKFNPNTPAMALALMLEVTNPPNRPTTQISRRPWRNGV